MNRITMYLFESIVRFITSFPTAIFIYLPILAILFISKKRTHIHIFQCCLEVIFIMYIITILKITGLIGTSFHVEWFTDSIQHFEFSLPFVGGSPMMIVLNLLLFVPFGLLLTVVLPKEKRTWLRILLLGFTFSFLIEFLQMFTGRFSELDDLIANSAGAFVGYWGYQLNHCLALYMFPRHKKNVRVES